MKQEMWVKTARYLLGQVTEHMEPGMMPSYYLQESIWSGCRTLSSMEIDLNPLTFVDVPAPWNRMEGC